MLGHKGHHGREERAGDPESRAGVEIRILVSGMKIATGEWKKAERNREETVQPGATVKGPAARESATGAETRGGHGALKTWGLVAPPNGGRP